MKFENVRVYNFEQALWGMRNPKKSWHLSDSYFGFDYYDQWGYNYEVAKEWLKDAKLEPDNPHYQQEFDRISTWLRKNGILRTHGDIVEYAYIGPKDMKLAQTLIKAGSEHRKFMRQIFVTVDITAPLYWWKEFDTYKVGTVANSTSTMHTLINEPITLECFEIDDYSQKLEYFVDDGGDTPCSWYTNEIWEGLIEDLERLRLKYLETKDKRYWKELIRLLPESWLQTRTVTMNYENLLAMCGKGQRRFHKLNEWSGQDYPGLFNFISFGRSLPYAQEFIFIDELEDSTNE